MRGIRTATLVSIFVLFLIPVTIDGVGVNYSFAVLPVAAAVVTGRLYKPPHAVLVVMALFALIFIVALVYQTSLMMHSLRRTFSFLVFMTLFSYAFMKLTRQMIVAFKLALILASVFMSLRMIVTYFMLGGSDLGYGAKHVVGTQRIGFIYLMALWLVYLDGAKRRWHPVLRYGSGLILLTGLFLTFSRSSIVALIGSGVLFSGHRLLEWLRRPRGRPILHAVGAVIAVAASIAILARLVPITFQFFKVYLFDISGVLERLGTEDSSEGIRVNIVQRITEFVLQNPFTGSGFLGIWILPTADAGSAHNQLTDVLFRTGPFGLLAYVCLLVLLLRYLYREERALFWGMVAVMIYGMFHETFKESNGGFILAFLIGMMAQSYRGRVRRDASPRRSMGAPLNNESVLLSPLQ